jgi:hypothetical protein
MIPEKLLVDRLEDMIVLHALNNTLDESDNSTINLSSAPKFFNKVIPGSLYDDFEFETFEILRHLQNDEITSYLTASLAQFQSYIPPKRIDAFYSKFCIHLGLSADSTHLLTIEEKKYLNIALNYYNVHFNKFKKFVAKLLSDQQKGILNLHAHIFTNSPVDPETDNPEPGPKETNPKRDQITFDDAKRLWQDTTITLRDWRYRARFDMCSIIENLDLTQEENKEILDHLTRLVKEFVDDLFNSRFKHPFEDIDDKNKISIANKDLNLIEDLLAGSIDANKEELLKEFFYVKEWKRTKIQLGKLIRKRIDIINNYDIHSTQCFADAEAILLYKGYLVEYLRVNNLLKTSDVSKPEGEKPARAIPSAFSYKKLSINGSALTNLFNYLKNEKNHFISKETDISDFRKIFNNMTPEKPILWIGTMEELAYFIRLLHNDYQLIDKMTNSIWKVTARLFTGENNLFYDPRKLRGQKTPARALLLEKAVERLK